MNIWAIYEETLSNPPTYIPIYILSILIGNQ